MEKFLTSIAKALAPIVAPIIAEKLMAVLPLIAAAVAKAVVDEIAKHVPDIPVLGDLMGVAEKVRENINVSVPDIDIPILSDIFDLTEWFNKK